MGKSNLNVFFFWTPLTIGIDLPIQTGARVGFHLTTLNGSHGLQVGSWCLYLDWLIQSQEIDTESSNWRHPVQEAFFTIFLRRRRIQLPPSGNKLWQHPSALPFVTSNASQKRTIQSLLAPCYVPFLKSNCLLFSLAADGQKGRKISCRWLLIFSWCVSVCVRVYCFSLRFIV